MPKAPSVETTEVVADLAHDMEIRELDPERHLCAPVAMDSMRAGKFIRPRTHSRTGSGSVLVTRRSTRLARLGSRSTEHLEPRRLI